jgi:hypothetical protein
MERKDQMNANLNRRGFMGIIGGAFSSLFFSPVFRKPRRVEASVPESARVLSFDEEINRYFANHPEAADALFGPVSKPVEFIEPSIQPNFEPITSIIKEEPVLAHPKSLRERDEEILFDNEGYWKEDITDRAGNHLLDEAPYGGWTKGKLTDEEYAAYRRWFNNNYPEIESSDESKSECSGVVESASGAREDSERFDSPRTEVLKAA